MVSRAFTRALPASLDRMHERTLTPPGMSFIACVRSWRDDEESSAALERRVQDALDAPASDSGVALLNADTGEVTVVQGGMETPPLQDNCRYFYAPQMLLSR